MGVCGLLCIEKDGYTACRLDHEICLISPDSSATSRSFFWKHCSVDICSGCPRYIAYLSHLVDGEFRGCWCCCHAAVAHTPPTHTLFTAVSSSLSAFGL